MDSDFNLALPGGQPIGSWHHYFLAIGIFAMVETCRNANKQGNDQPTGDGPEFGILRNLIGESDTLSFAQI